MPQTFFDEVNQAAQKVAKHFEASNSCRETPVAIRVVGEFSSGKTRFVKELFGSAIPEKLEPVSSREVQTLLPLEVTYGPMPSLSLIKHKENINSPEVIEKFDEFPERGKLADHSDADLRLRLSLPEEKLILKSGDGRSDSTDPRLLRIVDYPGWNSEDEAMGLDSLGLSSEWLNLAMIYVCPATRVETKTNRKILKIFLEALMDGDLEAATEKMPLYMVITSVNAGECQSMIGRLEQFVREILGDEVDNFPILILPVDFATISGSELAALRAAFWNHLDKAGCELGKPSGTKRKQDLEGAKELIAYLADCCGWIKKLRAIHAGLKPNGKFMGGRSV